ncbi:MAG: hypothetical protein ACTSRA_02355 [Promethearchaeota archaeon]
MTNLLLIPRQTRKKVGYYLLVLRPRSIDKWMPSFISCWLVLIITVIGRVLTFCQMHVVNVILAIVDY